MRSVLLMTVASAIGCGFTALSDINATNAIAYPYGVCAHVTRSERNAHNLKGTLDSMELAGMKYVRSDFDCGSMLRKDGKWDFSNYDRLIDQLESRGVTLLPIIYGNANPPVDMDSYAEYVRTIIRHYGRRLPVVEIWNEANLNSFFRGADPVAYAKTLATAYAAVKSVDPSIRVAYTGTAGVPFEWIRKTFEAGAAKCFDVMNVHPYSHPFQPEGTVDVNTEKLRKLMEEFGVGDKPIWFTEIGWPTHSISVSFSHIILAGLKVARPEQKCWNMVLVDVAADGPDPDQCMAEELESLLPAGSQVVACTQKESIRRIAAGGIDAVVYPFDETFPADTIDAVNAYIRDGGVLLDMGGLPCYFGMRGSEPVKGMQHGGALGRFPFGYRAWWSDKNGAYPERAQVFATERGIAEGVKQEPTGFVARRFLYPDRIGKDSEWIPLVAGKTTNGVDIVGAAVIRYHGERKGAAVLCSLYARSMGTNNEENQARFTARSLGLAFAEGIEAYFTYNLRSFEVDPYYSEHHFGLMHADFTPKPAFSAYGNFTRERPAGSVNKAGVWHNDERTLFFPQWTKPNGVKCGMIWALRGKCGKRVLKFTGGTPVFHNMYGRKMGVHQKADGEYVIVVDGSPMYFSGAELAMPID